MNERTFFLQGTLLCAIAAGCGGETESPGPATRGAGGESRQTRQLDEFGANQTEPYRVAEGVFQAHGVGNTQLVVTPDGNVVIDAGLPTSASDHRALLRQASDARTRFVIVTHAHADHAGGAGEWIEDGTQVIAHRSFLDVQHYLTELIPYFMPRNKIFYPDSVPDMPSALVNPIIQLLYPHLEPTVLVDDRYDFELGGVRFEVLHTPGAEGRDSISVWLPQQKILFTGDFFGPLFPMWPNLYTIRGEMLRFSMPYIHSLERVIALEPEILVPSHFEPIVGRERIRADLVRTRDAVRYVHDAVVEGMNGGKDVYTLMNEISLPPELELSEGHGKVSWGVRAIWEGYTGWFHESTVDLYAVPAKAVHPEVVEMAGGATAIAARARARVEAGEPVESLHLVEMALAADPHNRAALEARLAALELLLVRSGDVNHSEVYWLRHRIEATRKELARAS